MELRALVFQWQRSKVKKAWIFQDIFGILRIFRFFTKLDQNIIFRTVCDLWMQRNIYDVSKHGIKRAFQSLPLLLLPMFSRLFMRLKIVGFCERKTVGQKNIIWSVDSEQANPTWNAIPEWKKWIDTIHFSRSQFK